MKKLFISCPMRGRTEENIKDSMARMHKSNRQCTECWNRKMEE